MFSHLEHHRNLCRPALPHTEGFRAVGVPSRTKSALGVSKVLRFHPTDCSLPSSDYLVRGHDYNTNFTLNICAPALTSKDLRFHALSDSTSSNNVSAYYKKGDSIYSLGTTSSKPKFRGKKLVLEYTGGSLCPKLGSDGQPVDGEDSKDGYRKGAILSFSCDHELIGPAVISFVGQLNDCSYHFDVKTSSACATVKQQPLGPVAIFLIMYVLGAPLSSSIGALLN